MAGGQVVIKGAREHNLKGVDLSFPRDSLTTFTGVSGSGKSSLAHDTIYQEGQRRFLESLSAYARQFLGRMEKPKVDHIEGLSPTVSIDQKSVSRNPRSTVGTITEVLDFLRLLMARLGTPHCMTCGAVIEPWPTERIVEDVVARFGGMKEGVLVLAPVVRERKGEYRRELEDLRQKGFVRARIDGEVRRLDEEVRLDRYKMHTIEAVVDRLVASKEKQSRLADSIGQALSLGEGLVTVLSGAEERLYSRTMECPNGHGSLPELEPRLFSFNSPAGACPACEGLGETTAFDEDLLIADEEKSIRGRALRCTTIGGNVSYTRYDMAALDLVGKAYGFSVDVPFKDLTEEQRQVLFHGSGEREFEFRWARKGEHYRYEGQEVKTFPGIIPAMEAAIESHHAKHLEKLRRTVPCPACKGTRLRPEANAVRFREKTVADLVAMTVTEARAFFDGLVLSEKEQQIGRDLFREVAERMRFLDRVGLSYLRLERRASTLSGGESQRIRLAAQLGAGLRGILYVLDEPSIGLHPRDNERLVETLKDLRDQGNTVCVVEHDEVMMRESDFLVDVGPGAGVHGGEIVAAGPPEQVAEDRSSITAAYLRGDRTIPVPEKRRGPARAWLSVEGARQHNLKSVDVRFPLERFVCVTGVSGSGKSTLVNLILKRALRRKLHEAEEKPGAHRRIVGMAQLDKVVEIDQSPIGRTPRSNPATYVDLWTQVRDLYASLPESKVRGYPKGRFSFNVKGGRCEACGGAGVKVLEMQFMAPVEVPCEECEGMRFNAETLEIRFKDKSIHDVLEMTVEEALEFFAAIPKIALPLRLMADVGLTYLKLGQPSTTLSGGEAQRIKLAFELKRPATGRTIYLLDEPTTGLHFEDIKKLLAALDRLVEGGNSVVVIEHNLDVVKVADHVIDLGPEGGDGGGLLVAEGTPEEVAEVDASYTGVALRGVLGAHRSFPPRPERRMREGAAPRTDLHVVGARKNNLRGVDVRIPLGRFTVVTGVSGSGKTSLAFDTIFSEGQRRFVESLSTYARRFLGRLDRAPVDRIDGLGPAIAIDQKASGRNPRSTVATTTEIHDYLRLLYARAGRPHCPTHGTELVLHTPSSIAKLAVTTFPGKKGYVLAPVHVPDSLEGKPARFVAWIEDTKKRWREAGFVRWLVDGKELRLDEEVAGLGRKRAKDKPLPAMHLVIDRVVFRAEDRTRIADDLEQASSLGGGRAVIRTVDGEEVVFALDRSCPSCGFSVPSELHPRFFSFNHHLGACPDCNGLGFSSRCNPVLLVNRPERKLFGGQGKSAIDHPGAVFTWMVSPDDYYSSVLREVAREEGFDLEQPWKSLPKRAKELILHGAGDERFRVVFHESRHTLKRTYTMDARWKGLCPQIDKWYHREQGGTTAEAIERVMSLQACGTCGGERLAREPRAFRVGGKNLPALTALTVDDAIRFLQGLRLRKEEAAIAEEILREVGNRLRFLADVGLEYLALDRSAATLSGGEAQRIRLATQLGNRLVGVIYVLDEPTVGLHARDTERLLATLMELRDLGNTIIAVEHDETVIRRADYVLDIGPGAGHRGGRVVAAGTPTAVEATPESVTGAYLRGEKTVPIPLARRAGEGEPLVLRGAAVHNLKTVTATFPMGALTAVTGVSGSGKSSLVMDALLPALRGLPPNGVEVDGAERVRDLHVVDQEAIGSTPASVPATYLKIFDHVRELFASTVEAKAMGFKPGRFSFNIWGGRCEACEGKGSIQVEMHFLADVWMQCEICRGKRYDSETLKVLYRGRTIADVLEMEATEALAFFAAHPKIAGALQVMVDVGLGYLKLGQPGNTLSGGEAQRLKLASELSRPSSDGTVYVLDEPTTGLHLDDVASLVRVLHALVEKGGTVIVIEHHLDVIASCDHVIDLGPEAGLAGGRVVVEGTPETVAACKASHTGRFLAHKLEAAASAAGAHSRKEVM